MTDTTAGLALVAAVARLTAENEALKAELEAYRRHEDWCCAHGQPKEAEE